MVALVHQDKPPRDLSPTASQTPYIDSSATVHKMQDKNILTGRGAWSNSTIATAGKHRIEAKCQGEYTINMSG